MKSILRPWLFAGLLMLTGSLLGEDRIPWVADFNTACGMAAEQRRLVLLHFYNDNCGPCVRLEQNVFSKTEVADAVSQNYLAVKVHAGKNPQLATRYHINQWPTDVFVTPSGLEVSRTVSPQKPSEYIAVLNKVALQAGVGAARQPNNPLNTIAQSANSAAQSATQAARNSVQTAATSGQATVKNATNNATSSATAGMSGAMSYFGQQAQQVSNETQRAAAEAQQKWNATKQQAQNAYDQTRATAETSVRQATATAEQAQQQVATTATQWSNQAQTAVQNAEQKATAAAQQATETANKWGAEVNSTAQQLENTAQRLENTVQRYDQQASTAYQQVHDQATQASQRVQQQVQSTKQEWQNTANQASQEVTATAQNLKQQASALTSSFVDRRSAFMPVETSPAAAATTPTVPVAPSTTASPTTVPEPTSTSPAATAVTTSPAQPAPAVAATTAPATTAPATSSFSAPPVTTKAPAFVEAPATTAAAPAITTTAAAPTVTSNPWMAEKPANAPPAPAVAAAPQQQPQSPPTAPAEPTFANHQMVPVSQAPQIALDGFCPVTLIEKMAINPADRGAWKKGDKRFGAIHNGRTYLFATAEQQQKFLANPDAYAPALSGCDPVLYAERGQLIDGKRAYGIVTPDKHIYLFADEASRNRFEQSPAGYAAAVQQAMSRPAGGNMYR